jgi:CheY-like chemotaxis protein
LAEYLRARYSLIITTEAITTEPTTSKAHKRNLADIAAQSIETQSTGAQSTGAQSEEEAGDTAHEEYQEDLAWLHLAAPQEFLDIEQMIAAALQTLEPLFQTLKLTVQSHSSLDLPRVTVNAIALRQALMITLTAMARLAAGKQLSVGTRFDARAAHIEIEPAGDATALEVDENLVMAQRLMALSGGSLAIHEHAKDGGDATPNHSPGVTLSLPLTQPATVLIIEDNQDALQLFQRYLTGTRYHPVVTRNPAEGIALAQQLKPQIILLDVMLPGIDGWELLARLRRHPDTEEIPIIICTILPEEQLAWALGASGFVRKPLAREELLEALQAANLHRR